MGERTTQEKEKKHNKCKLMLGGQTSRLDVEVFTATITFASYRASQGFKSLGLYFLMCPWIFKDKDIKV